MTNINNYNFETNLGTKHNILKMMFGEEKFGIGAHIRVTWISFKQMIGAKVSPDEATEKMVYDTITKMVKATSKCFSVCHQVLPSRPTLEGVKEFIKGEILEGTTQKIKKTLLALQNSQYQFKLTKLSAVSRQAMFTDIAEIVSEKLGTTPLQSANTPSDPNDHSGHKASTQAPTGTGK